MKETKSREQIEAIFYPKSIAVIGANKVKGSVPYDIFNNILKDGFTGTLYPVSPREHSINAVKAYKYVIDIPDPVDMGVLVFPASVSELAMEQCGQKGIKSMIIISAGFKEAGGKGIEREEKVKEIAAKYGISFIGPNCLGVINTDPVCSFNASFSRAMPEEGNIAFLSQSGALCTAVLDYARGKHIGFSKFVSFGNKADVDEVDLMLYLKDDPKTKVILLYLEEISDGRRLMDAAQTVIRESGKPVLILKSGRTAEGAMAAASHTGSMAGSDAIAEAAFTQAGIIRCDDIEQMFNYAIALAWQPLPKGRSAAVITNAGGPGVLATDRAVKEGLTIARFSEETTRILKKALPASANVKNPVDIIGDARADRYTAAIDAVAADESTDGIGVILTPQSMTDIEDIAHEVCRAAEHSGKALYSSFMGETDVAPGVQILLKNRIPHYILPEDMCRAMAVAARFREIRDRKDSWDSRRTLSCPPDLKKHVGSVLSSGKVYLTEHQALDLLADAGFSVPRHALVRDRADLGKTLSEFSGPVAMKIMSPQILHKSDAGGVLLNIGTAEEAGKGWDRIMENAGKAVPDAQITGIMLEEMATSGLEMILGLKKDPAFGPVIMVGAGGIYTEVFRDSALAVAPVTHKMAGDLISSLRIHPLLSGFRGSAELDAEALAETLKKLSDLTLMIPEISELDINPLIVNEQGRGVTIADARIILES